MAFMVASTLVRSAVRASAAVTARRAFVGARVATRPAAAHIVAAARSTSSVASVRMGMESDIRERLTALYKETPCMPIMVRLAWHDSGMSRKMAPCLGVLFIVSKAVRCAPIAYWALAQVLLRRLQRKVCRATANLCVLAVFMCPSSLPPVFLLRNLNSFLFVAQARMTRSLGRVGPSPPSA